MDDRNVFPDYALPNGSTPSTSARDETTHKIVQQLSAMHEPNKVRERFDRAMFEALYQGLDPEELAWRIINEVRKEAFEINDGEILEHLTQLCRDDPLDTTVHERNVRCQNRGLFVGAAYRIAPEWRQSIAEINRVSSWSREDETDDWKMLYENKDWSSFQQRSASRSADKGNANQQSDDTSAMPACHSLSTGVDGGSGQEDPY